MTVLVATGAVLLLFTAYLWFDHRRVLRRRWECADERGYGDPPDPREHVDHDPEWDEEPMPGRCARRETKEGDEWAT